MPSMIGELRVNYEQSTTVQNVDFLSGNYAHKNGFKIIIFSNCSYLQVKVYNLSCSPSIAIDDS
jgi:hypothetical protein